VIDGDKNLLTPNVVRVNALGLENVKALRNAFDGVTHFGCKRYYDDSLRKAEGFKSMGLFYNDYVFEIPEGSGSMSFGDRHFSIAFNKGKELIYHNIIAKYRLK
jgi:hypothetical protein